MIKGKVTTKTLLAHIFEQMDALAKGEIDSYTACAQAKLAAQANATLSYELKKTALEVKLAELKNDTAEIRKLKIRDIESE